MFEIGTLDQLAEITMGQSPKGSTVRHEGKIPLLNGPTEFGYNHPIPVQFTTDPKRFAKKGDLLFCVRGSTGKMNWADQDYAIGRGLAAIRPKDKISKYFLRGSIEFFLKHLISAANGSVFSNINKDQLHKMKCFIPDKKSIKNINQILEIFSKKIELNNNMNQTLEETAKTLFKSWFIDFDPVRAKVEKKKIRFSKEINDLFPDSFEDSELGKMPKGWKIKPLDEIADFLNGLALQKYPVVENEIKYPVLKIAQLRKGSTKNQDEYSSLVPEKYIINNGDYIFAWSASLIAKFWLGGKAALNQHLFKVTSNNYSTWFIAGWVEKHLFKFINIASSKATSMRQIKKEDLSNALTIKKKKKILYIAENIFKPLRDRANLCLLENNIIKEMRDTLIPKLISGEISISDVKKNIDEAKI